LNILNYLFVAHLTNPEVHCPGILPSFGNSRGGLIPIIVTPESSKRFAKSPGDR